MRMFYFIFIFSVLALNIRAQEPIQLIEKHFVKKNEVLFRVVPTSKKMFELMKFNSLKIIRYNLVNGNLSNEVVVNDLLHPYWIADTLNWMRLMRKDKNKTAFIYNSLYQNKIDVKQNSQQRDKIEKMAYDLMLLSCDFDVEIAKACGLFFKDTSIAGNTKYTYKIAVYTSSTSITTKPILNFNISTSELSSNIKIENITCKSKNAVATLKWKALNYKSCYAGYNIERSVDSLNFIKINQSPVILFSSQFEKNKENIFYNDTMPDTNKKFFYRIRGINFFGEESEPSNVVSTYSSPKINSIPLIDSILVIENRKVRLHWRMEKHIETTLLKNYILMHSEKDNGKYRLIHSSVNKLEFTDTNPSSSNFYKIGAITFNNDTIYSYSRMATIIDTIPPSIPINLKGIVDAKGNVTLSWAKGSEKDLKGYKIFKANALNEEFVQLNNKFVEDTMFNDKLNLKTLSKKIFYSVAASDRNFNTSEKSLAIEIKRPDTIPPAVPIITSVSSTNDGVNITFILSKSEDVLKHIIYRKKQTETDFVNISSLLNNNSNEFFVDTTCKFGETYTYYLCAYDGSDNRSPSKSLIIKYETGFRKKLTKVNFVVDRTLKNISLNWEYPEKEIEKFVLYRSKESEPLTIIKTVDGKTLSFIDKTANIGNVYEYRLKAVLFNGAESVISDPIKVVY